MGGRLQQVALRGHNRSRGSRESVDAVGDAKSSDVVIPSEENCSTRNRLPATGPSTGVGTRCDVAGKEVNSIVLFPSIDTPEYEPCTKIRGEIFKAHEVIRPKHHDIESRFARGVPDTISSAGGPSRVAALDPDNLTGDGSRPAP